MSREWSGNYEDSTYPYGFWEQTVKNAIASKNGQKVLRQLEAALLALTSKRLIEGSLCRNGEVCALGALALYQKPRLRAWLDLQREVKEMEEDFDDGPGLPEMGDFARRKLGVTYSLGATIAERNDSQLRETPEQRYERMLAWIRSNLKEPAAA